MRDMDDLFAALGKSKFRGRFRLSGKEAAYLRQKGLDTILQHGRDFVTKRLADAYPANDGRQTPMRNHPVFEDSVQRLAYSVQVLKRYPLYAKRSFRTKMDEPSRVPRPFVHHPSVR